MNKNWIITIVIIALIIIVVAIANKNVLGYSNSFQFFKCEPNWIKSQFVDNLVLRVQDLTAEENCKNNCYDAYKTTSIKIENTIQPLTNSTGFYCYCDVNNCK